MSFFSLSLLLCIHQSSSHQAEQEQKLWPLEAVSGIVPFGQGMGIAAGAAAAKHHTWHAQRKRDVHIAACWLAQMRGARYMARGCQRRLHQRRIWRHTPGRSLAQHAKREFQFLGCSTWLIERAAPTLGLYSQFHSGAIRSMRLGQLLRISSAQVNLEPGFFRQDRKSTRLNSSHVSISYAV